jgi:putative ABC transport system substrate-binding protein
MADNQKKPDFTWMTNWVEAGFLASAGIDIKETGQRLADKIVKVLAGAKPGDLPIENPGKYAITLNLDRAKKLNLEIPVDILEAADIIYAKKSIHP